MRRIIPGLVDLALGAGIAQAQSPAIKQRQDLMKANAEALGAPDAMVRGKAPFDLAKVQASFKTLADDSLKLKALWPEDSKTGGNTRALPAIWENTKDFLEWFDGLATDAKAAAESIKTEADLKAAWPNIVDYCGSCHKDFRAPTK
jgi:cytochrome c556